MVDDATRTMSDEPAPGDVLLGYTDDKPVFVDYDWPRGTPEGMSDRVACVDHAVTQPDPNAKLTVYRWNRHSRLSREWFNWL